MSSYTNQGGLWDNQRKFEASHPDFTGTINIAGTEYEIAGWMNTNKHPKAPTINLKVTAPPVPMPKAEPKKEDDDDIPF